uniref:Ras association domain-containing protein 1 n=1 Tax=Steinernema glaseri TaxID=37863 RepID=A0A1I7ZBE5_9BILA
MSDWLTQLGIGGNTVAQEEPPCTCALDNMMIQDEVPKSAKRSPQRNHNADDIDFNVHDGTISLDTESDIWEPSFLLNFDTVKTSYCDTLERQHFGPLSDLMTVSSQLGRGHEFSTLALIHPTWCDKCGDFIWGFLQQAVRCQNCNYTCHNKCQKLITLDCRSTGSTLKSDFFASLKRDSLENNDGNLTATNPLFDDTKRFGVIYPSLKEMFISSNIPPEEVKVEEIYVKSTSEAASEEYSCIFAPDTINETIQEYNSRSAGFEISLRDGDVFSGCIQIHMNFTRPINVVADEAPPRVYDFVDDTGKSSTMGRTITSFFLPPNTEKIVHVNSSMTAREMIVTLLRKFKVADNPRKFALYQQIVEPDVSTKTLRKKMTRIVDHDFPLKLAVLWKCQNIEANFLLQENDTGDILWEAFEVPELNNFLNILDIEEKQYAQNIRDRFEMYRRSLDRVLEARNLQLPENNLHSTML